jgi:spore germination protein GerM
MSRNCDGSGYGTRNAVNSSGVASAMARVLVTVILAALVAGCGAVAEEASRGSAESGVTVQPGAARTTVYFLADDGAAPIGVRRTIEARTPYAQRALEALLAGPTPEETASGITTAIPEGTQLLAMTYERHGADQTVSFSGLPQEGVDVLTQVRIITQLVRTLIGVSGTERVWVLNEGRPWGLTLRSGRIDNGPFDYGDFMGWNVGRGCPGTETVTCDRFVALP